MIKGQKIGASVAKLTTILKIFRMFWPENSAAGMKLAVFTVTLGYL